MPTARIAAGVVIAIMAVSLTGCSTEQGKSRTIIENGNKIVTVLSSQENTSLNEFQLQKIEKFNNIRGLDWLDNDNMLVTKDNTNLKPANIDGETAYLKNLYTFNIKTKNEKIIHEENHNQGFASYSPDKKHIFYEQNVDKTSSGFIMNSNGKNAIKVTGKSILKASGYEWLDNEKVLYSDVDGKIYISYLNGKQVEFINTEHKNITDIIKAGNYIYYITDDCRLMRVEINTKKIEKIKDNVIAMTPSPDGKKLAVVKKSNEAKMALVLTDLDGIEVTGILAEASQIYSTSWSPDQSELVYFEIDENDGSSGLFVTDTKTQNSMQISVDTGFPAECIKWSPSGKEVMASTSVYEGSTYEYVTYVITWK